MLQQYLAQKLTTAGVVERQSHPQPRAPPMQGQHPTSSSRVPKPPAAPNLITSPLTARSGGVGVAGPSGGHAVVPSRMLAKSRLDQHPISHHPLTAVITSPVRPSGGAGANLIRSPLSPRQGRGTAMPTTHRGAQQQQQQPSTEDLLEAAQRRDAELLSVFRVRRERYDEAVTRANKILNAFGDATELLPKEHRVQVKPYAEDGSPMAEPKPMYHLKPQGRDVKVFNDSTWVEDPFLLDDVDAEEQAELNEFVKRKEAKRNAAKAAEAKAAAARAAASSALAMPPVRRAPSIVLHSGLHAMAATSGLELSQRSTVSDSAVSPSETSLSVVGGEGDPGDFIFNSNGTTPRRLVGGATPRATPRGGAVPRQSLVAVGDSRSGSRLGETTPNGATSPAGGVPVVDTEDLSHPSEVARKRRIIRKLWMGNVIQLRDLYASKAGGFHNIGGDGTADGSGGGGGAGLPIPTIEFQDNPREEGAEVLELTESASNFNSPGSPGGTRRVPFSSRPIPPVPQFGSRSLAWIAESVCHDLNSVTLSTENILRASLNTHTRRTGALDQEIQRCSYLANKAIAWSEGAALHASMYETGEGIVSSGIVGEMAVQRREVVAVHEEVSQLQKQVDDVTATMESTRADIEVQTKRNAVLSFALDTHRVLDPEDRDTNSDHREAMIRLRQQLHTALTELKQKSSSAMAMASSTQQQRRGTTTAGFSGAASGALPPTAAELKEVEDAAQRLMDALSERYGGLKSLSVVSQWVMKAKGAANRRRAASVATQQ